MKAKDSLISMFDAGVSSVSGEKSIIQAFEREQNFKPDLIVAVGKAASEMCLGAHTVFGHDIPAVVATKYQHSAPALLENRLVTIVESGHPIADENSLKAGKLLMQAVHSVPTGGALLLLVSGGASAIAEILPDDMSLSDWQALNNEMIASGKSIAEINHKRKSISLIKNGRLLENYTGNNVIVCAISDVEGDHISIIGSGIGDVNRTSATHEVKLVATNQLARNAVADRAGTLGYTVRQNTEMLYDDVFKLSTELGLFIRGAEKGVYIWGGEPTIILPENPGNGGRNQSLGLALAKEIYGTEGIHILVAGTDGTDGPTDAAGAVVDDSTFRFPAQAQKALDTANAGEYLNHVGNRFVTGPTGTNVMDLLIAIIE